MLRAIQGMKPTQTEYGLNQSRKFLCEIRDALRKLVPRRNAYHHACADCLDFYANTKYWFTAYAYDSFKSRVFSYDDLGYTCKGKAPAKRYNAQYVWGQLNFWDRQTIEQPDASLSQCRRGTVALPTAESCYSGSNGPLRRAYDYKARKELLRTLECKAGVPWPTKWHWSFRNGKLYGSPWLDAYIDDNEKAKCAELLARLKATPVLYVGEHEARAITSALSSSSSTSVSTSMTPDKGSVKEENGEKEKEPSKAVKAVKVIEQPPSPSPPALLTLRPS